MNWMFDTGCLILDTIKRMPYLIPAKDGIFDQHPEAGIQYPILI